MKAIAKKIGKLTFLERYLRELPITFTVVENAVETPEEYAVRRVQRAAEHFRMLGYCPTRTQLVEKASMRDEMAKRAPVDEAILAALDQLSTEFPD